MLYNVVLVLRHNKVSQLSTYIYPLPLEPLCQTTSALGLLRWFSGKEPARQCRRRKRCEFNPWAGKIPWRRKWQPTAVFLPGTFHGPRSLAGCSPWGLKESDMTTQARTPSHPSNSFEEPRPVALFPTLLVFVFSQVDSGEACLAQIQPRWWIFL